MAVMLVGENREFKPCPCFDTSRGYVVYRLEDGIEVKGCTGVGGRGCGRSCPVVGMLSLGVAERRMLVDAGEKETCGIRSVPIAEAEER